MLFNWPIDEIVYSIFILESIVLIKTLACFERRDVSFFQLVNPFFF